MNAAELSRLQAQDLLSVNFNPAILGNFSQRQVLFNDFPGQSLEKVPLVIPVFKASIGLLGPSNPEIMTYPATNDSVVNWDFFNGTGSYLTISSSSNDHGEATFIVVDDSKPGMDENQRIPRSFRRPRVASTGNPLNDAKIVKQNLLCYLNSQTKTLGTEVEGPTDDEPYVVIRNKKGVYIATIGSCKIFGMVLKPKLEAYDKSLHGSVELHGREINRPRKKIVNLS